MKRGAMYMDRIQLVPRLRRCWRNTVPYSELDPTEKADRLENILRHIMAEHSGAFFICGFGGGKDPSGLPDHIYICPQYGSDVLVRYDKENLE